MMALKSVSGLRAMWVAIWNHQTCDSGGWEKRGEPILGVAPSIPWTMENTFGGL